jgi:phosphomannomutase
LKGQNRGLGLASILMTELIVSVSGIRGIVGESLTEKEVASFSTALAGELRAGAVVVSRDGRPSGEMLVRAAASALAECGRAVIDIGIAPTPTCGLAVRQLRAAGAVQVTASHNPGQWNGLKFFGADGRVITARVGEAVKQRQQSGVRQPSEKRGRITKDPNALTWHQERVTAALDAGRLRRAGLRVFVDANGGAGGPLSRNLLVALGCDVTAHACDADGRFRHEAEPTEDNVREIGPLVKRAKANVGFVLDPDADRLAILDETGRYIGEELTLALAVSYRLRQQRGPVVINMSTSRVTEDVARSHGTACYRSAVGEANVVERMLEVGAVIGGEGNGGVIDPRIGYVRDAFIAMGLILSLLAESGQPLSTLVAELPAYFIVKEKYDVERNRLTSVLEGLMRRFPEARVDRGDGLRLDWPDRWVHVRPSNTEPVVRVIAEARSEGEAHRLAQSIGELLAG